MLNSIRFTVRNLTFNNANTGTPDSVLANMFTYLFAYSCTYLLRLVVDPLPISSTADQRDLELGLDVPT